MNDEDHMRHVFNLAERNMSGGGWPIAAVIAGPEGQQIAEGAHFFHQSHNPLDHAEMIAIREACRALKSAVLTECSIYLIAPPCPMCLAAISQMKVGRIVTALDTAKRDEIWHKLPSLQGLYDRLDKTLKREEPEFRTLDSLAPRAGEILSQWHDKL